VTSDEPRRPDRPDSQRGKIPRVDEPVQDEDDQTISVSNSSSTAALTVCISPAAHGRLFLFGRFNTVRTPPQERVKDADPDAA
jgi:hypothetical protein